MQKPFQKDIDFLQEELAHYKYIARKYEQECDEPHARTFKQQCDQILTALETVENKQTTAVSEWAALSPSKRRALLLPLFEALEQTVDHIAACGCPTFSTFLDTYLSGYLMDLQNFKE